MSAALARIVGVDFGSRVKVAKRNTVPLPADKWQTSVKRQRLGVGTKS